jgi:hypothetical protein
MAKAATLIPLLALAACSGVPQGQYPSSPSASKPGGCDCRVERYMKAPWDAGRLAAVNRESGLRAWSLTGSTMFWAQWAP